MQQLIINSGSCVITSERAALVCRSRNREPKRSIPRRSSPLVGSSKISKSFFAQSAEAIAVRCFCPPDNEAGCRSFSSRIPSRANTASASAAEAPVFIITSSNTLSAKSCRLTSCITIKLRLLRSSAVKYAPPTAMLPFEGISPASACAKVLLPDPLSPMSATTECSGSASRSISSTRVEP